MTGCRGEGVALWSSKSVCTSGAWYVRGQIDACEMCNRSVGWCKALSPLLPALMLDTLMDAIRKEKGNESRRKAESIYVNDGKDNGKLRMQR